MMAADPIRILPLPEVARRTAYSTAKINRALAADVAEGTPGRRFPLPLKPTYEGGRREWREKDLVEWLDRRATTR